MPQQPNPSNEMATPPLKKVRGEYRPRAEQIAACLPAEGARDACHVVARTLGTNTSDLVKVALLGILDKYGEHLIGCQAEVDLLRSVCSNGGQG